MFANMDLAAKTQAPSSKENIGLLKKFFCKSLFRDITTQLCPHAIQVPRKIISKDITKGQMFKMVYVHKYCPHEVPGSGNVKEKKKSFPAAE